MLHFRIRKYSFPFSEKNSLTCWVKCKKNIIYYGQASKNVPWISEWNGHREIFGLHQAIENSRQFLVLRRDIWLKTVVGCPCLLTSFRKPPSLLIFNAAQIKIQSHQWIPVSPSIWGESIALSLHIREYKTVLDSGLHAVDSGFQSPGSWIPPSKFPRFQIQQAKKIPGFRIWIVLHCASLGLQAN